MSSMSHLRLMFFAALAAPVVGLFVALIALALMSDVERISPSQDVFASWDMNSQDAELPQLEGALLERPLLWASRRPLAPALAAAEGAQESQKPAGPNKPALAGYRLAGMFLSDLDAGVIVVGAKNRQRLVVGQSIDGWMLEEIRDDGAVFVNSGARGSRARSLVKLEHLLPTGGNQSAARTSTNANAEVARDPAAPDEQEP